MRAAPGQAAGESSPPLRRNLKLMSAGVLGSALIQYALYFWLARYLGSQAYGAFSIALTIAVLAAPLCDLGLSVSLVRTCSRRPEMLPETLGACLAWRALLVLPVAALTACVCLLAGYSAEILWLLVPLFLATLCDGVSTLCSAVFQAREEMAGSSAILVGRNLLRAGALLGAVLAGAGAGTLAILFLLSSVLAAALAWCLVRARTPVRFRSGALRPALRDALPFGLAIIAVLLHLQVDVALLGAFRGESEVGLYHAGMRFVVLAQMIPQTVAMVAAPRAYRIGMVGIDPSSGFYRLQATALAMLGLCGSLVLALHGETLVDLCLGLKYQHSAFLVVAVAPVIFIKFLSSPLGDTLSGIGRQRHLTLASWLALGVNVAANLLLIPARGAEGAVLATLISEAFLLATLVAMASRAGIECGWTRILRHPLATAGAVLLLLPICTAALPGAARYALLPCGLLVYAWLVWTRPTEEERVLFGRPRGHAS